MAAARARRAFRQGGAWPGAAGRRQLRDAGRRPAGGRRRAAYRRWQADHRRAGAHRAGPVVRDPGGTRDLVGRIPERRPGCAGHRSDRAPGGPRFVGGAGARHGRRATQQILRRTNAAALLREPDGAGCLCDVRRDRCALPPAGDPDAARGRDGAPDRAAEGSHRGTSAGGRTRSRRKVERDRGDEGHGHLHLPPGRHGLAFRRRLAGARYLRLRRHPGGPHRGLPGTGHGAGRGLRLGRDGAWPRRRGAGAADGAARLPGSRVAGRSACPDPPDPDPASHAATLSRQATQFITLQPGESVAGTACRLSHEAPPPGAARVLNPRRTSCDSWSSSRPARTARPA
ncbi:hypothetical protein VARIO8X_60515 [Burkholderiales bacterium 8X]|nr:hypothetical protein VARIO8X_60515 [Burkholderiales bacterium 8X]